LKRGSNTEFGAKDYFEMGSTNSTHSFDRNILLVRKPWPLVFAILLSLFLLFGCQTMSVRDQVEKANLLMQQEKYQAAFEEYEKAIAIDPTLGEVYKGRGQALIELGRYGDAIADLTHALKIKPGLTDAYYYRGIAHAQMGNPGNAIADFTASLLEEPEQPVVYLARGTIFLNIKQYDKAIEDFKTSISKPKGIRYSSAFLYLGYCFEKLGKKEKALEAYKKFLIYADPADNRLKMARESVNRVSK